jgi:hypothetical protein
MRKNVELATQNTARRPGPTPRPSGYEHLLKDPSRAAQIVINIKLPKMKGNKNLNGLIN